MDTTALNNGYSLALERKWPASKKWKSFVGRKDSILKWAYVCDHPKAMDRHQVWIPQSTTVVDAELEQIFYGLVKIWRQATGGLSITNRRFGHPAYKAIIRLGPETIPLILRELKENPDWWFDALQELTKANPTRPSDTFEQAVDAWISWGKKNHLIPSNAGASQGSQLSIPKT
jgi:hypothetical protein